jgi:hypothetical protein
MDPPPQGNGKAPGNGNGQQPTDTEQAFAPEPWIWRDPTTLPPRQWLVGTTLLRGYATVLGSMGGVGKTAYAIAAALAVITGRRDILGQHVFKTGPAWLITLEDDREELERRIHAALIAHEIRPENIQGRLFVNDATRRPLLLAKANALGAFEVCGDAERISAGIQRNGIMLTVIDPLVKSHRVNENNNEHMDGLITLGNDIARDTHSSLLFPCHFRKGGGEYGARDAIRGGGALVDGSRANRTLTQMNPEDAKKEFNIPPEDAFRYIRVNDPKANMAPRQVATWFQLVPVPLGNTEVDPTYPAGDNVQAAMPWQPPSAFDGIDVIILRRIFDRLRAGPEPGWFYSPDARAKYRARDVIAEETGKNTNQAAAVLKAWITNGVLSCEEYRTPSYNDSSRVVLNEAKIAEILAPSRAFDD